VSRPLQPLDPTWWRRVSGSHHYEQQDGRARMHKLRTGRRVTGWSIYVYEAGVTQRICEYPSFAQAKRRAHEITSDPERLAQLRTGVPIEKETA
jgi:hypothetical protein